jgi:hypothetical protein
LSDTSYAEAPTDDIGPSLLAKQPLTDKDFTQDINENWDVIFQHVESRLQSMRSWRWMKWTYWAVLGKFFLAYRYIWLVVANKFSRGHPVNDAIIDSTGLMAVRTCAAGMWTGLTSPSRPWFKYDSALPWIIIDADARAWLEDAQARVYTVLKQSNFYGQMAQGFKDEVVFGGAPVIIYEDADDVIRLYNPCAGEYFTDVGARLTNDTLYREFAFNVIQIVDMFKVDNCPVEVTNAWREGGASLQLEFIIAHAIEPNFAIANRGRDADDRVFVVPEIFPWREVYWLRGYKTFQPLSKKGFHVKPFIYLAWARASNDPYAHGPCEEALGDNKQIQQETLRKAEFIDKGVRPPMGANPELKNEPASIRPGEVTYMSTEGGKKGFWPLFEPNPVWLNALTADIKLVADRIEKCLYVTLFMAITRMEGVQPRNELELSKRDLERLQELGPVIELNENELDDAHMRILDILSRRRMLKPIPASLHGVPLKISYTSIMRLAQQGAESVAMKDIFQTGGVLSSAAKAAGLPDPLRTIDLDWALKHYADLNNGPSRMFFTADQIAQHDQIRSAELQKAQIPGQAAAAVDAAKTMSETQLPGGNSALGALMGGGQGG